MQLQDISSMHGVNQSHMYLYKSFKTTVMVVQNIHIYEIFQYNFNIHLISFVSFICENLLLFGDSERVYCHCHIK